MTFLLNRILKISLRDLTSKPKNCQFRLRFEVFEIRTEAQMERNIRELKARLSIEEQLSLKLRRFIEANIPELAGKIRVEVVSSDKQK